MGFKKRILEEAKDITDRHIMAAIYQQMTPEERERALSDKMATRKGYGGILGSIGHGAMWGGLLGGGTALANETLDTNFDPVKTGLISGGITAALNAPGGYIEGKEGQKDFQKAINKRKEKELKQLSDEVTQYFGDNGLNKQDRRNLINKLKGQYL